MFPAAHGVVSQGGKGAQPPGPGGAFRYYRLLMTAGPTSGFLGVSELELREEVGGPSIAVGYPDEHASAPSQSSNVYRPARAFDGSLESSWQMVHNGAYPQWLQFDFGEDNARELAEYAVGAAHTFANRTPTAWVFQGSLDGEAWVDLDAQSGQGDWVTSELRAYAL